MEISNLKHSAVNLPNLTPLRGIAALLVVYFHFNEIAVQFVKPEQTMFLRKCYLMVDLFFIMSGFIMLHVYGESFSKSFSGKNFGAFIKARFARLYPLHLLTLVAAIILFYISTEPVDPVSARVCNPMAIPTNLLLLHSFGFHSIFTWNVPSWSISAEWWAYMVFPFLALLLAKNKKIGLIMISLIATALYFLIVFVLPRTNPFAPEIPYLNHDLDVTFDYGYLRGLAGFMMGMLVYVAYQNKKISNFFSKDSVAIACIIILVILMHFGFNDLIYIPLFMFIVLCFSANDGVITKICSLKPLQYLGNISYSVYMVHILIIFYVGDYFLETLGITFKVNQDHQVSFNFGLWASTLFALLVIVVSTITYYSIEKPCRRWINKKK